MIRNTRWVCYCRELSSWLTTPPSMTSVRNRSAQGRLWRLGMGEVSPATLSADCPGPCRKTHDCRQPSDPATGVASIKAGHMRQTLSPCPIMRKPSPEVFGHRPEKARGHVHRQPGYTLPEVVKLGCATRVDFTTERALFGTPWQYKRKSGLRAVQSKAKEDFPPCARCRPQAGDCIGSINLNLQLERGGCLA